MSAPAPAYLQLFPWKQKDLESGALYEFAWRYELDISPADLWPFIIDSSRFNRAVGYDGISYSEENGLLFGARGEGKTREEWIEYPFEWSKPYYGHRMRKYTKGYISFNKTIFYIEKHPRGCTITVYIGNVSAHPLAKKLVPGYMRPFEAKYGAALAKIAEAVKEQKSVESIFGLSRLQLSEDRLQLLDRLLSQLSAKDESGLGKKLQSFIVNAELDALAKIKPLQLAREWESDADDVIRLFLQATRTGIFNLTWNTICPHCRGQRDSLSSLGSIPTQSRCDVCDIDFAVGDENSIEVNFKLNGQIADLPRVMYCSAEPSRKLHILAQRLVEPGDQTITISSPVEQIATRVRYQTAVEYRPAEQKGGVDWQTAASDSGETLLTVSNRSGVGVQLVYELMPWGNDILGPGRVFRLQEFRDLFSEEHLSTQLQLDVGQQTIMFTDLVGSTRFYEEAGDAQAFATLRNYFQTIYQEARRSNGAVVKTIGDGAMLVFADPLSAATTALGLIRKFNGGSHAIRITLHSGKCLAVNLNTGIDYFGRTVNLAAKLQTACSGQEIVCTQSVYDFQGVQSFLQKENTVAREDIFTHPSFAQEFKVFRVGL